MKNIYVVTITKSMDEDTEYGILGHRYFKNRDDARKEMLKDFEQTKADYDENDDIDESHGMDYADLQANNECFISWNVIELA